MIVGFCAFFCAPVVQVLTISAGRCTGKLSCFICCSDSLVVVFCATLCALTFNKVSVLLPPPVGEVGRVAGVESPPFTFLQSRMQPTRPGRCGRMDGLRTDWTSFPAPYQFPRFHEFNATFVAGLGYR